MHLKFWQKPKPPKVLEEVESPEIQRARQERMHAEQLLSQTRATGLQVSQIANRSQRILEANNFTRTIDLCMERRK